MSAMLNTVLRGGPAWGAGPWNGAIRVLTVDERQFGSNITYTEPEPVDFAAVTNEGLSRAFRTALLLTGSAREAEAAMVDAMRSADREAMSDRELFLGTVVAALDRRYEASAQTEDLDQVSSILPIELMRVSRLSLDLRRCFILRVLAGFSREECSRLLHLEVRRVDEAASAAAQELARICQ
jgi:hypothetical protein